MPLTGGHTGATHTGEHRPPEGVVQEGQRDLVARAAHDDVGRRRGPVREVNGVARGQGPPPGRGTATAKCPPGPARIRQTP